MIQQANNTQVRQNNVVIGTLAGVGQLILTVFKGSLHCVLAIGQSVAFGYRVFVNTAEEHGIRRN